MTTNNHPAHGPVSLDRLHQIREILSKAAAQSDGGNLGYAMADAVKVIDGAIAAFGAEPQRNPVLAYADSYRDMAKRGVESIPVWSVITDLERNIAPLYATPPSPVVPDDVLDTLQKVARIRLDLNDFDGDRRGIADCLGNAEEALIEVVNRSAAMLQAGNHTEQHLDMVVHSGDDNEKADCRLPFDQWLSQQNEPIDVDCGCVTTEAFYHWLRVAYEAGNSPVTPDGWQLVPKEPTEAMNKAGWAAINEHDAINPTYRAMLAAAPQQDVRLALEIGMSRYAGAMQKLVDSGD
ncbi:hypothetical protein [Citrobacter portucalensis]|uniref:Eaa1 n=1 Tax=Citrobacter portucalensis TaxID=1639133 RepID=A0A9X4JMD3_9ENTR|nr:hypothetical protein [Citrobacter portucalensis]MDE9621660.1 hypothetical protein [Citrobacter portucalensis]